MNEFDKDNYVYLKDYAKFNDIKTTYAEYSAGIMGNGVTIAYMPMTDGQDCRMIAVSVSYCSPEDTFIKKHGKYFALEKLYNGEYVQLPLGTFYRSLKPKDFKQILLEMFTPVD